jgi:hypothetical protein
MNIALIQEKMMQEKTIACFNTIQDNRLLLFYKVNNCQAHCHACEYVNTHVEPTSTHVEPTYTHIHTRRAYRGALWCPAQEHGYEEREANVATALLMIQESGRVETWLMTLVTYTKHRLMASVTIATAFC